MNVRRLSCAWLSGGSMAQERAEHQEGDSGLGDGREPASGVSSLSARGVFLAHVREVTPDTPRRVPRDQIAR